jgi:predicted nucleotidyltransferase
VHFWWQAFSKPKRNPEKDLDALVQSLQGALGDRLKNVVVFGSMASGEFHAERSDVNVLIVATLSFDMLEQVSPALKPWLAKGHTAPVLAAPEELLGMARSFPIEFMDMIDHHKVLHGDDPLIRLLVDSRHLRAQCEHDLALAQLKLRQAIAAAGGDEQRLRHALIRSGRSVLAILFAGVRLEEAGARLDKITAMDRLASRADFDASVLNRIADLRLRRATDNIKDLAVHYLELIEAVLKYLRK